MQSEIIGWNLSVLARYEIFDLLKGKVEIEGIWVVKVVICSVFVLIMPRRLVWDVTYERPR